MDTLNRKLDKMLGNEEGHAYAWGGSSLLVVILLIILLIWLL